MLIGIRPLSNYIKFIKDKLKLIMHQFKLIKHIIN